MIVSTLKWRRAMMAYSHSWLKGYRPKGFTVETWKPLGKPARDLLRRVQKNMAARGILDLKYVDGTLNTKTQELLIPPLSLGEKAVTYGMTQVGTHESPWGSNSGADVHRYQSSTGAYGAAWCASFVWYCWQEAGYKGPTSAGAWNTTDSIGTRVALSQAREGYPVSFNIGEGHVGLYLSHDADSVRTLDGNTNNQVAIRDRPISQIHAICRPTGG